MPESQLPVDLVLLDIHEVRARVCLGTSTIYHMMDTGAFPSSVALAPRTVRWLKSEINAWIAEKVAARNAPGNPSSIVVSTRSPPGGGAP